MRPSKDNFIPIPPLASQFFYGPQESMPERRLMAAVLADAMNILRCGQAHDDNRKLARAYRDALVWVMAERNAWPFCFVAVCEALGLDANKVKAQILVGAIAKASARDWTRPAAPRPER
ncbi:MAG: hypothetical protein ACHQ9S_27860 [Candidatus Binatia bacterium]